MIELDYIFTVLSKNKKISKIINQTRNHINGWIYEFLTNNDSYILKVIIMYGTDIENIINIK